MEKSLTEGNSLRQILGFAFPLLLGNLFQQLYNLADSVIVGRTLGVQALASVGASASITFLILGFCIGSCSGFAIPVAQRFGAKDYSGMRRYVYNAVILTGAIAVLFTVVTVIYCRQILGLLKTPEDIMDGAYDYLVIIFIGIFATMLYNLAAGILRALGDSKSPFYFLAISTVLNIFGDLFTILVLGMGVEGAALSTVIAQAISGILCIIYMVKRFEILRMNREERRFSGRLQKTLFFMGVPMGLQFSITAIGSIMLQTAVNSLGSVYVASYSTAMKVKQFMMAPFDALGNTAATFCGQNLGAGKLDRVKKGIFQTTMIGLVYAVFAGFAMFLFGGWMIRIFVSAEEAEVIRYAYLQIRCLAFFYVFLAVLGVFRSSAQGLGHSGSAMIAGVVEMIARTVMSVFVIPVYGYIAVCFTDQTAWISAVIYLAIDLWLILRSEARKSASA